MVLIIIRSHTSFCARTYIFVRWQQFDYRLHVDMQSSRRRGWSRLRRRRVLQNVRRQGHVRSRRNRRKLLQSYTGDGFQPLHLRIHSRRQAIQFSPSKSHQLAIRRHPDRCPCLDRRERDVRRGKTE